MADDLDRSERTVKTALRELENAGLITRVRQGWNQANRIFLQIPDRVQVSSRPEGNICHLTSAPVGVMFLVILNVIRALRVHNQQDCCIINIDNSRS